MVPSDVTAWLLEQSAAVVLLSAALLYGYRQHLKALAAADRRGQRICKEQMQHVRALTEQVIASAEKCLDGLQAELRHLQDQHQADLRRMETRVDQYQAAAQQREAQLLELLAIGHGEPDDRTS